jgi:hypothetical protein
MKRLLLIMAVTLTLSGCVAYPGYYDYGYDGPGYDYGYYGSYYGPFFYPYAYGYVAPSVSIGITGFHGGHGLHHGGFHGGHGFHHGGWRR